MKKLVAIEPSGGMRAAWDKGLEKLGLGDAEDRYVTVDGSFDDFSKSGVEKGQVDLVVIAQAWHWCPDYDAALVSTFTPISPMFAYESASLHSCIHSYTNTTDASAK